MKRKIWRLITAAALLGMMVLTPAGGAVRAMSPMTEAVERNWSRWAETGHTVVYKTLIHELANPSYRGEDAAALAALARYLRKHNPEQPLSRDEVCSLIQSEKSLPQQYANFVKTLEEMPRSLYASGRPNFDLLQQGPIGDCFFFSGLGWLAKYRPQVIMEAIAPADDGYRVHFPNGIQVQVKAPTDAEIVFFNSASTVQDGLWTTVLEKAVGAVLPRYTQRVVNNAEPAYNIALGGGPAMIEKIWTERTPTVLYLGQQTSRERVREALIAIQERRLMAQALTPKRSIAHSVAGDHVYAIFGFDRERDVLTLWNPWGDEFSPQGPEGIEHGYAREHGVFRMPLREFMEVYRLLSFE